MTGTQHFRLIDSGVRDGREQIAYDAALTALHETGVVPDTVRFMRFPPTVLIGRHQILAHEVHLERCQAEGVGLVRRISGGGAIYLDEGQVGWEVVARRSTLRLGGLADWAAAISGAVAAGLSDAFDVEARFRPRNDIEVGGRKIGGTGGYFSGDTLVYQGTVLVDMDAARMARLINIPAGKLARHGAGASESRVVTLKELLGRAPPVGEVQEAVLAGLAKRLGIVTQAAEMSPAEIALTRRLHDEEIGTDAFVTGREVAGGEEVLQATRTTPGGIVTALVRLEGRGGGRRVREIMITGDFFVAPPRAIADLEAHLRSVGLSDVAGEIDAFLAKTQIAAISISADDFKAVVAEALSQDA